MTLQQDAGVHVRWPAPRHATQRYRVLRELIVRLTGSYRNVNARAVHGRTTSVFVELAEALLLVAPGGVAAF